MFVVNGAVIPHKQTEVLSIQGEKFSLDYECGMDERSSSSTVKLSLKLTKIGDKIRSSASIEQECWFTPSSAKQRQSNNRPQFSFSTQIISTGGHLFTRLDSERDVSETLEGQVWGPVFWVAQLNANFRETRRRKRRYATNRRPGCENEYRLEIDPVDGCLVTGQWRSVQSIDNPLGCSSSGLSEEQQFVAFQIVIKTNEESFSELQQQKKKQQEYQEKVLLRHLKSFLYDGIYSDVEFIVQGESIPAHTRMILGGSPVLSAMFENEMTEASSRTVVVDDIKPIVFRQLLHYLYTGDATIKVDGEEIIESLFMAADKYQVEAIKEASSLALYKKLSIGNGFRYLLFEPSQRTWKRQPSK